MFIRTATTIDKQAFGNKINQCTSFIKWVGKKKLFLAMADKINATEVVEFFEKKGLDSYIMENLSSLDMFHVPNANPNITFSAKMLYKQHIEHFTTDFSFDSLFKSSTDKKMLGDLNPQSFMKLMKEQAPQKQYKPWKEFQLA